MPCGDPAETTDRPEGPGAAGANLAPMTSTPTRRLAITLVGLFLLGWGLGVLVVHGFPGFFHSEVDRPVNHWLHHHHVRVVTTVLNPVSRLGSSVAVLAVVLIAGGAVAAWRRNRSLLLTLAVADAGGAAIAFAVKLAVRRGQAEVPRGLGGVTNLAFPSGHATLAAAVYGTLAVLVARRAAAAPTRLQRGLRTATAVGLLGLVLLIGVARVYSGQHDTTDVLAGWVLGGLWAGAATAGAWRRPQPGSLTTDTSGSQVRQGARPDSAANSAVVVARRGWSWTSRQFGRW